MMKPIPYTEKIYFDVNFVDKKWSNKICNIEYLVFVASGMPIQKKMYKIFCREIES